MSLNTKQISDKRVVATSLAASSLDIVFNLAATLLTGSTVMLAQALQGSSDFMANCVLFVGVQRANRAADKKHRFGYGRELFFWVLVGSVLMFVGTGGLSFYFGLLQFLHPEHLRDMSAAFIVLCLGLAANSYSLSVSVRRINKAIAQQSWLQLLFHSSIIETKMTLLIDAMGTCAACLGMIALGLYVASGDAQFDGLGSMTIGLGMMCGTILLAKDARELIIGRSASDEIIAEIQQAAASVEGVAAVLDLLTMYIGSAKLLAIVEVRLQDRLRPQDIERVVAQLKKAIHARVPLVQHIQVEIRPPGRSATVRRSRRHTL